MTGRKADVCMAAHLAAEIAHRMVVPGGEVRGIPRSHSGGSEGSFFLVCPSEYGSD